jgi:hypothetical protein
MNTTQYVLIPTSSTSTSIYCLHEDSLWTICTFLNARDLLRLSNSSKRLFVLTQHSELWKVLTRHAQTSTTLPPSTPQTPILTTHYEQQQQQQQRQPTTWKQQYLSYIRSHTFNPNNMGEILYLSNQSQTVHSIKQSSVTDWGTVACETVLVSGHVYHWKIHVNRVLSEVSGSAPHLVIGIAEAITDYSGHSGQSKRIVGGSFDTGYHYIPVYGSKGHRGRRINNYAPCTILSSGDVIGVTLDTTRSSVLNDQKLKQLAIKYKSHMYDASFIHFIRETCAEDADTVENCGANLRFSFNGCPLGVAFHGITGQDFLWALSLSGGGQSVTIEY